MHVSFSFSVLSQEFGWEECLLNYLVYVGWDVKPQFKSQSRIYCCTLVAVWLSGNGVGHINEVALRRARLVLERVIARGYTVLMDESIIGREGGGVVLHTAGEV